MVNIRVTDEQLASGAYMRTLTKRELIGNFFFARIGLGREACDELVHRAVMSLLLQTRRPSVPGSDGL